MSVKITDLIISDPDLPQPNPTAAYWQREPHRLATTQSATLAPQTDIAIIGSGITGMAVARTLLASHPTATVTVLEARTLCSGATGRNGGQMAANAGEEYEHLATMVGADQAAQIVQFTLENLRQMEALIATDAPTVCDWQSVQKLRVFQTPAAFARFQHSLARMERDHPSLRGIYTVIDAPQLRRDHRIDAAGACLLPAGTVWPYKLVTSVWERLCAEYPARLSIETGTPVTAVEHETVAGVDAYRLRTPRGDLVAAQVAHCTNGYTGHLLPRLRGAIHPFKGTMTVQDPGSAMANQGGSLSWGFHYPARYDAASQRYAAGLYYLLQHADSGCFYFGGEDTQVQECLTADDRTVGDASVQQLRDRLPGFLGRPGDASWPLVSAWSGIMGFSADGLPLVGALPSSLTGRDGNGEYVAAAFNGYGMANCLLSGTALAKMMLGEDVPGWFPEAYRVDERRMQERLTVKQAVRLFEKEDDL